MQLQSSVCLHYAALQRWHRSVQECVHYMSKQDKKSVVTLTLAITTLAIWPCLAKVQLVST